MKKSVLILFLSVLLVNGRAEHVPNTYGVDVEKEQAGPYLLTTVDWGSFVPFYATGPIGSRGASTSTEVGMSGTPLVNGCLLGSDCTSKGYSSCTPTIANPNIYTCEPCISNPPPAYVGAYKATWGAFAIDTRISLLKEKPVEFVFKPIELALDAPDAVEVKKSGAGKFNISAKATHYGINISHKIVWKVSYVRRGQTITQIVNTRPEDVVNGASRPPLNVSGTTHRDFTVEASVTGFNCMNEKKAKGIAIQVEEDAPPPCNSCKTGDASGTAPPPIMLAGNPVLVNSGIKNESITEFSYPVKGGGRFAFERFFYGNGRRGSFGRGWSSNQGAALAFMDFVERPKIQKPTEGGNLSVSIDTSVTEQSSVLSPGSGAGNDPSGFSANSYVKVTLPDGQEILFKKEIVGPGSYFSPPGYGHLFLLRDESNNFTLISKSGARWFFETQGGSAGGIGQLVETSDKNGWKTTYEYTSSGTDTIMTIRTPGGTDKANPAGRVVTITRRQNGLYSKVEVRESDTSPVFQEFRYFYDESNVVLTRVEGRQFDAFSETPELFYEADYAYDSNFMLVSKTDPRGQVLKKAAYTLEGGKVTEERDGNGTLRFRFVYGDGFTDKFDARGQRWRYVFNDAGFMTSSIDPEGNRKDFKYNDDFNNTQINETPAPGNGDARTTSMSYDSFNNMKTRTDAELKSESWTYLSRGVACPTCDGFVDTYTNKRNFVTDNDYDVNGNLTEVEEPSELAAQIKTNFGYDLATQELISVTDARGNPTTFTYNNEGDLEEISAPAGSVSFTYDALGRVNSVTDELGRTTVFIVDGFGNRVKTTFADGSAISQEFNGLNLLTRVNLQGASGASTQRDREFSYDSAQMLTSILDAENGSTSFGYDADGNRTSMTDPNGNSWQTEYDLLNRPFLERNPLGQTTLREYDMWGNVTRLTDGNGNVTRFTYDKLNRQVSMTDAENRTTQFVYDAEGNMTKLIDAKNQETDFVYNARDLLESETDAKDVTVKSFVYDANGNVDTLADGRGVVTDFTYDTANRLISEAPIGDATGVGGFTYVYGSPSNLNKGFNLFQVTDSRGVETILYDPLDRVTSNTKPTGESLVHTYDSRGNRLTTTLNFRPSAGLSPISQSWTYDNLNRNITATDFAGNVKTLNFDPGSRLTNELLPNGIKTDYNYDSANRLTSIINKKVASDSVITQAIYALDGVGNRVSKTDTLGTRQYSYDRTYQLTQVQTALAAIQETATQRVAPGEAKTVSYAYDDAGNRQSKTSALTGGLPNEAVSYGYNSANEMTNAGGITQVFDQNGNLVTRDGETLAWDYRNRLVGVQEAGKPNWSAKYDYRNRIAERVVGSDSFAMVYDDQGRLVTEASNVAGLPKATHSYDSVGLVAMDNGNGAEYPLFDGLGSAVGVVDSQGRAVSFEEFGEFGEVAGGQAHPFRYTGRRGAYYDQRLDKTIHWRRWYDQNLGTWLSRDPVGVFGGPNQYMYVGNSPVDLIDVNGMEPEPSPQPIPRPVPRPPTPTPIPLPEPGTKEFYQSLSGSSNCPGEWKPVKNSAVKYNIYGLLYGVKGQQVECVTCGNSGVDNWTITLNRGAYTTNPSDDTGGSLSFSGRQTGCDDCGNPNDSFKPVKFNFNY